jgi:hypothetical protein
LEDFPYICFVDLLLYSTPRQDEARDEDEKSISQRMSGLSPAAALTGQVRRKRRWPYEGGEDRMKAARAA